MQQQNQQVKLKSPTVSYKDAIHAWVNAGYSAFPCVVFSSVNGKRDKKPLVDWVDFQSRLPSTDELTKWTTNSRILNSYGIGIATGSVSGIVVVDIDLPKQQDPTADNGGTLVDDGKISTELFDLFPWLDPLNLPPMCITGGGGLHLYYLEQNGKQTKNGTNICNNQNPALPNVDIRGKGGFVVAPPSLVWEHNPLINKISRSTSSYRWMLPTIAPPLSASLPELPQEITARVITSRTFVMPSQGIVPDDNRVRLKNYENIPEDGIVKRGERHAILTSLAMREANKAKNSKDLAILPHKIKELARTMEQSDDWNPDGEEVEEIARSAIKKKLNESSPAWFQIEPAIEKGAKKGLKDLMIAEELELWGFKITKVERIGELLDIVVLVDDHPRMVEIRMADLVNQTKFRQAFLLGTNRTVESIKTKAYEAFIDKLSKEIVELEDLGLSLKEVLLDYLRNRYTTLSESEDEEESADNVKTRLIDRYKNTLRFKITAITRDDMFRAYLPAGIVATLREIGAKTVKESIGNVWTWVMDA